MTEKRNAGQYPIRPSPELRSKLEEAARAGGRSLHAEIISRLEASFIGKETTEERDKRRAELRMLAQEEIRSMMEQGLIPSTTPPKK